MCITQHNIRCRDAYDRQLAFWADAPPLYLEELRPGPGDGGVCFRRLVAGQGSAYSLKYQYPRVRVCVCERERERERETDRQTDRVTERVTEKESDRERE